MNYLRRYALAGAVTLIAVPAHASFTETFDSGTQDVGDWLLSTGSTAFRVIESSGGNPGGYLHAKVSTAEPAWQTADTSWQPGFNDSFKRNSVFTGDWTDQGVTNFSVDLNVFGYGSWTRDRALTLKLREWDPTNQSILYTATDTIVNLPDPVQPGWNHYSFAIDAASGAVPNGWVFTREDGSTARNSEWGTFLHHVDLVSIEYGKPGYFYPSFGTWNLGIDNISIQTAPEPCSMAALGLGALALIRKRRSQKR